VCFKGLKGDDGIKIYRSFVGACKKTNHASIIELTLPEDVCANYRFYSENQVKLIRTRFRGKFGVI
jgi:hypothetical protein